MEKYDEILGFDLPKDFFIVEGINDDGNPWYNIKSGKSKNDNGEDIYENSVAINKGEINSSPFAEEWTDSGFPLKGEFDTYCTVITKEMNVLILTVNAYTSFIWIKIDSHVYVLTSNKVIRDESGLENWVKFLNCVLDSVRIDGKSGNYEELTTEKILSKSTDLDEKAAQNEQFPYAKPLNGQHTHLDFLNKSKAGASLFGGLLTVNETGTEYSFQSISSMANETDSSELSSIYESIKESDSGNFDLVETAHDMAELFRVNADVFDRAHDREQEILNGYIQRASFYNKLRSFAWTFAAYCDKKKVNPVSVDFDTIQEIVDYIGSREDVNYTADSYSPTICSGNDLHVYYIPNAVSDSKKNKLLEITNAGADANQLRTSEIKSLEGLRNELTYMYPAIRAIYDELEAIRDRDEALVGGVADILYAWCSMTYAAREPIFSEDGPMNCWWEHPDNQEDWETKFRINQLEEGINQEKEWIKQHSKDLSKCEITIKDQTFVFTGVEGLDEWLNILQKLIDMGGVERGAVSGKTDYLVCNPMYAGESKVKHALEQRIKGKDVKIVLFDDFLKAINMTVKSPKEKLAELKAATEKEKVVKHLKPVIRPEVKAVKKEMPISFTYNEGLKGKGDGYVIDIPDGFIIKEGAENRDFIAYLPKEDTPDDYQTSNFIIFAGQKQEDEIYSKFRTVAEFMSIGGVINDAISKVFAETKVIKYDRKDLPGVILYGFDHGCLHANIILGIDTYMQAMRVQIQNVARHNMADYEQIVTELFGRMMANKPVELLKELDADEFVTMSADSNSVSEWIDLIQEYVNHISIARNLQQNAIVRIFKQNGNGNISKLKKDIKNMLRTISGYAETELVKAEAIYTLKRAEYPGNSALKKMENALNNLIDLSYQEVNIDNEHFDATSDIAIDVKGRLGKSVISSIDAITEESSNLSKNLKDALIKAKAENNKVILEVDDTKNSLEDEKRIITEQQRKSEEERIAREKAQVEKEASETRKQEIVERKEKAESLKIDRIKVEQERTDPINKNTSDRIEKLTAKYDNHLSFKLPYNYEIDSGVNDDGQKYFGILCRTSLNSDGEKTFDLRVSIRRIDGMIPEKKRNLNADYPATDFGTISEMSIGLQLGSSTSSYDSSHKIQILIYIIAISGIDCTYILVAKRSGRESSFDENTEMIADNMNQILKSMSIDGNGVNAEKINAWHVKKILQEKNVSNNGISELDLVPSKTKNDPEEENQILREQQRKSEEKRIAREKTQTKTEEAESRKQEIAEWKEKVNKLIIDRKMEEQERSDQINKNTSDQIAMIIKAKEEKLAICEKEIDALKQHIETAKRELNTLGFFKFSKKKELNLAIKSDTSKIKEKEDSKGRILKEFQRDMDATESSKASKLKALSEELKKKYVIPNIPEREMKYKQDKKDIIYVLCIYGPKTTTELIQSEPFQNNISKQKMAALLSQLIREGIVTKTKDNNVVYYSLSLLDD